MGIKPGYKQTEIGVIPVDWETDTIGNQCRITTGKRNTQDNDLNGKYPFFVRSQTIEKLNSYSYDGEAVLTAGDGVGTGKVFHYINGRFDYHQRVYCMNSFSDKLEGYYFYLFFKHNFLSQIIKYTAKSSVDSVRMEMISKMSIPLPPILEQKKIRTALQDTFNLVKTLEKLIAKKKLIKQGVMQELLTGKKRLSGFTGEWETKSIGACFSILRGSGLSKSQLHSTGQYKCILYGELFTTYTDIIDKVHSATNVCEGVESISGDILLPGSTTTTGIDLAKSSALKIGGVLLGGDINILRPIEKLDSAFISLYINVNKRYSIATKTKGTTIHHLHANDLRDIIIEMPSLEEQIAISMLIMELDKEIAFLEKRLSKYRSIKQAMMQELLTGRIRLL